MDLPVRTELSIKNQFIIADSVFFGKRCSIYKVPVRGQKAARSEKNFVGLSMMCYRLEKASRT